MRSCRSDVPWAGVSSRMNNRLTPVKAQDDRMGHGVIIPLGNVQQVPPTAGQSTIDVAGRVEFEAWFHVRLGKPTEQCREDGEL